MEGREKMQTVLIALTLGASFISALVLQRVVLEALLLFVDPRRRAK